MEPLTVRRADPELTSEATGREANPGAAQPEKYVMVTDVLGTFRGHAGSLSGQAVAVKEGSRSGSGTASDGAGAGQGWVAARPGERAPLLSSMEPRA